MNFLIDYNLTGDAVLFWGTLAAHPIICKFAIQNKHSTEIVIGNGLKVRDLSKINNYYTNLNKIGEAIGVQEREW